jgi:hypothetical protein
VGCDLGTHPTNASGTENPQAPEAAGTVLEAREGDLSSEGGTPTIRRQYVRRLDDPSTSNDESNDQPLGYYGTVTLDVHSAGSGHRYILDADVHGSVVERLYFPKGGWVDFPRCVVDDALTGECRDEKGRLWRFSGRNGLTPSH